MSNVGQHLLSGGLSGFASTVCLQPFDLLKTRVQQADKSRVQGILQLTRNVIASDGLGGLWRGTAPSLIRNVPGVALYMTGLTQVRTIMALSPALASLRSKKPSASASTSSHASVLPTLSSQGNLIAGAATRVGVGFILNPFSVLKARFESSGLYAYESVPRAFVAIVRAGPAELLRGFLPSALRDAPYAGFFVLFYEKIKSEVSYILPPTSALTSSTVHVVSGASAGAIATIITHPFDVIKTKVQVRREDRYHGFFRTIQTIWTVRGPSGFLDGVSLRLSRKILSSAIGWAAYEGLLLALRKSKRQEAD